jgi:hypothetical protein
MSFVVIFLLPIDVSSAFYNDCLVNSHVGCNNASTTNDSNCSVDCSLLVCHNPGALASGNADQCQEHCPLGHYAFICRLPLLVLWYIIYWIFTILTWGILPFVQSYVMASYFSIKKKILRVILENVIYYASYVVILVIVLVSLLAQNTISIGDVPSLIATAANTWGLLILTLLLGYGLVEVPRTLWYASRRQWTLNQCYFKAAQIYSDMSEATQLLNEVNEKVKVLARDLHYRDPLRKYVDLIIKKFPEDMRTRFNPGHDDFEDFKSDRDQSVTKKSLEKIYQKTIKATRNKHRKTIEWLDLTDKALDLEDTLTNARSDTRTFECSYRKKGSGAVYSFLSVLEWYWKVKLRHWVYRIGAVLLCIFSVIIVWSEATFGIPLPGDRHLSITANIIYWGHYSSNYIVVELTSVITVAYLSVCTYFTVFKIRIFNFYYLTPRHCTDEYSLLFSAMLLSRLAFPICLNYLYMANVVELSPSQQDRPETAFQTATGTTDFIPWITEGFYIYYPIIIFLVCIATFFKLGQRLMSCIGYQTFIGEDAFSIDFIDEGKALIKRERRIRERYLSRGELRNKLQQSIADELIGEGGPAKPRPKEPSNTDKFLKSLQKFKKLRKSGSRSERAQYTVNDSSPEGDTVQLMANDELSERTSHITSSTTTRTSAPRRDLFDDL